MVTSWLPHGLRSSGYVVARSEIHLPVSEKPAPPLNEGLTALQRCSVRRWNIWRRRVRKGCPLVHTRDTFDVECTSRPKIAAVICSEGTRSRDALGERAQGIRIDQRGSDRIGSGLQQRKTVQGVGHEELDVRARPMQTYVQVEHVRRRIRAHPR